MPKKEASFLIRCSAEELANWKDAAREVGLTLAAWIRKSVNDYIAREPSPLEETAFVKTAKRVMQEPERREGDTISPFKVSPSCSAPGDRCRRFKVATCDPCRKLNAK